METELIKAFSENTENVLNNKESADSEIELSRAEIANASKGNNLCIMLKGQPLPNKAEMEPYTLYVFEKEGKIFADSKQNKTEPLDISGAIGEDNLKRLNERIYNPHGDETDPLNLKDQPMIESIFKASSAKDSQLISRTYRQASIDTSTYLKKGVGQAVSSVDKALYNIPSNFMNQLVLPIAIGATNIGITTLFGSKKNLPYPASSLVGRYINGAGKYINENWEKQKKTYTLIYGLDAGISGFHTVMNSKALGRATSIVTMVLGTAAMAAATGGVFLAVGGGAATLMTAAGTRAEMRREDLENKQRYLNDTIASKDTQQNIAQRLQASNPNINLYKSLGIDEPKLHTTKPKTIEYKVTSTNLDAERSIVANTAANSAALAFDIFSGNMHALATKANATIAGSLASGASQISETEAKERLNIKIRKLEDVAFGENKPKNIDELREASKQEIIKTKQLELAEKDLQKAIAEGKINDLKTIFDNHRANAEAECKKEWAIEADTWNRLKRDKEAMELLEESQKYGPHSKEAEKFNNKFQEYKEEATIFSQKDKKTFFEKVKAFMIPTNTHYNDNSKTFNFFSKIGRCLNKELFSERTSYKKGEITNHFSESSAYIRENKILHRQLDLDSKEPTKENIISKSTKHVNHKNVAKSTEIADKTTNISAPATPGMSRANSDISRGA